MYARYGKRLFDLVAATLGIIALSPLLLIVAVLNRLVLGAPVFFRQVRPGRRARPFVICKFRTMAEAADPSGRQLPDSARSCALGNLWRSSSLDELPELWNVIRGEMSLVGPRPLLMEYLPLYTEQQSRRHEVRPGMTGWAQVNGRNAIDWDRKFDLDVWYVDHLSWWLDLKIVALTLLQLVRRRGISHDGHVTMPRFRGDEGRRT